MKNIISKINIVAVALLIIIFSSVFVSASNVNKVDISNIFNDVQKDSWYYDAVQMVYEKSIMKGTSPEMFTPNGMVTWAQAIKIASEIRCLYNKDIIEEIDGPWYEKYVNYMRENSILPANYPLGYPDTEINRSDISNLFYSVIPEENLLQMNSCTFNDITQDSNEKAIQVLCNAGILTGKGENKFDPNEKATRAEIAVIIDRVLLPVNRVIQDKKQNLNMKNQTTLFDNGGLAVETTDNTFYIYCDKTPTENIYEIISYRNDEDIKTIYTTNEKIKKLSVGPDNRLYFVSNGKIKSITQDGKDLKTAYIGAKNINNPIDYYTFYDGDLYVTENYEVGNSIDAFRWRICVIKDEKINIIQKDITKDMLGGEALYLFNGYLYKVFYDGQEYGICKIDINTGNQTTVIEKIYKGDAAFIDQNVWYTNKVGNSIEVVVSPLAMPEFKHIVGTYEGLDCNYSTITAGDESIYLQVSSFKKVWEINKHGEMVEIVNTDNVNIEKFTRTKHGIVLNAIENITQLIHNSMPVVINGNERITYGEFLNKISYSNRPYTVNQGDKVEEKGVTKGEDGKINVCIQRDIKKKNMDLILEFSINNLTGKDAKINSFDICLNGEQDIIERRFMINLEIGNGENKTFSIFIPKEEFSKLNERFKIGWKFDAKFKR